MTDRGEVKMIEKKKKTDNGDNALHNANVDACSDPATNAVKIQVLRIIRLMNTDRQPNTKGNMADP